MSLRDGDCEVWIARTDLARTTRADATYAEPAHARTTHSGPSSAYGGTGSAYGGTGSAYAGLEHAGTSYPGLIGDLNEVERERLAAYRRTADRNRFVLGCAITRRVVGAYLGVDPADVPLDRTCQDCGKPHGKVRVAGDPLRLSVSHSGDLVLVAFHRSNEIGVDVEQVNPDLDTSTLASVVLAPEEVEALASVPSAERARAFTTYWTRKEAVLKATGDGMRVELSRLVISSPSSAAKVLRWRRFPAEHIHLQDIRLPDAGHVAALADLGPKAVPVVTRDAATILS
ncbi:4'-phosphopantetheinyl transferase family protein [Kribbella deserti]|uniref:4'-phosphopantetheinyl transferase family protein n=1 Tax=Kribbella deserti TaxID=1926257 RepID=A0ABV6QDB4_9ACTN